MSSLKRFLQRLGANREERGQGEGGEGVLFPPVGKEGR